MLVWLDKVVCIEDMVDEQISLFIFFYFIRSVWMHEIWTRDQMMSMHTPAFKHVRNKHESFHFKTFATVFMFIIEF